MNKAELKQIAPYLYEIPKEHRHDMRVPARFYADAELLRAALGDKSLDQLVNSATLPGIVAYALAMPDIHQGYGFPIGGVVATHVPDGVISPGGVGYDINCGVRLLGTRLRRDEIAPYLDELATQLQRNCPHGVGRGGEFELSRATLRRWTWSAPRRTAASTGPTRTRSARALSNGRATNWARSARATTSSRSTWCGHGPLPRPDRGPDSLRLAWLRPSGLHRLRGPLPEGRPQV